MSDEARINGDVWQEYECPIQKSDSDLEGANRAWRGKEFFCHLCGNSHTAGVDVQINTFVEMNGWGMHQILPENEEELHELIGGLNE